MRTRIQRIIASTLILTAAVCAITALAGTGAVGVDATPSAAGGAPADAVVSVSGAVNGIASGTGIAAFLAPGGWKAATMIVVGLVLLYLGVAKDFEPLLLVPIGFGTVFVNVPFAAMGSDHGLLGIIF
ncbi:MAG: sodium ion-translocating decarboxylase subunit beta, partial [Lentisphaerae bacterium]|nr:sodium ion-translocating decarboxylase subunit beta [Lentisphaerota bacterium]